MKLPTPIKTDNPLPLPSEMPTLCLWSVLLTSYLLLCLTESFLQWDIKNLSFIKSWNQVCNLSWKTGGFGRVRVLAVWVQVPVWVLAGFEPQHVSSSPNLGCTVSEWHIKQTITVFYYILKFSTKNMCCYLYKFFFKAVNDKTTMRYHFAPTRLVKIK